MRFLQELGRRLGILLLCGFLGACMVRLAPGFAIDDRELDTRLSAESLASLRADQAGGNVFAFYVRYLRRATAGDLGESRSLARPVTTLLQERFPVTLRSIMLGLTGAWIAGVVLAALVSLSSAWILRAFSTSLSAILLSTPAALAGLLLFLAGWPVAAGIAMVVFPKIYFYLQEICREGLQAPHVLSSRARGLHPARILATHVFAPASRPLLGLFGVTITMALGAAIPMEVVCDAPGLGQLAWKASLSRDLPLLTGLTLLVAIVTMAANTLSDWASDRTQRGVS